MDLERVADYPLWACSFLVQLPIDAPVGGNAIFGADFWREEMGPMLLGLDG